MYLLSGMNETRARAAEAGWWACGCSCQSAANGAALSYARRCALFTLVGMACEDDLDAETPDAPGSVLPVGTGPAANPILSLDAASLLPRPATSARKAGRVSSLPLPPQDSAGHSSIVSGGFAAAPSRLEFAAASALAAAGLLIAAASASLSNAVPAAGSASSSVGAGPKTPLSPDVLRRHPSGQSSLQRSPWLREAS